MSNLNTVWTNLDGRRRFVVIGATLAVFGAILFLARGTTTQDMSLLYAGLEGNTSGEVITALDQRGIPYDVRGTSIFVPTAERDRLRMSLAGEGLPANGAQGYELLDSLSGFGTTSQMFDAAYWRAKEGELARTILASPHIRSARVHISANTAQPFRREQTPTAAVNVASTHGALTSSQADALRFLVASAVPGLAPQDVAVIDGVAGVIAANDQSGAQPEAAERTADIRQRVERLLAARVGPGNAVVEVSVDTITETESIIERRFDPETRVAISTDIQESNESSQDSGSADVTVASNLPDGDGANGQGSAASENTESRTVTNFEVSETQREVVRTPGAIKRVTVAVLVNNIETTDSDGVTSFEPRPPEELEDLRVLVESAVGYDADRGDAITIRSMAFETLPDMGSTASDPVPEASPIDVMTLIQSGVLAVVALILGLFVIRPILLSGKNSVPRLDNSGLAVASPPLGENPQVIDGFTNPTTVTSLSGTTAPGGSGQTTTETDPVGRLRDLIDDRRDEAIQVLQSWIDEPGSEASQ